MTKWARVAGLMMVLLVAGAFLLAPGAAPANHPKHLKQPECGVLGVTYTNTDDGCKVTGFTPGYPEGIPMRITLAEDELLDAGDLIVEVGGVSAMGEPKNLEDLCQAGYRTGNLRIKVADGKTGKVDTFYLP